jgi:predicted membrane-bound spermidine synthase
MEVIWIRAFTPVLKNLTYSFASLLSVYLLGTLTGSFLYRKHIGKNQIVSNEKLISALAAFSLLPIVMNDPRIHPGAFSVLISIFPLCSVLGYLTPKLIDQYSLGEPFSGGKAYAINIIGCIIGPLLSSYLLLPYLGVKRSLLLLSAPFLIILLLYFKKEISRSGWSMAMCGVALFFFFRSAYVYVSYEDLYASIPGSEIRRDHTGTVVSYGTGLQKRLLVNGIGITALTPITKAMAHLPLAMCPQKPESALVICFGMGTTFRSLLSWDIQTTAVELVPSVKDAFGYYFKDANQLKANPKARIIIDDGRRYLSRTSEMFDVITIDPPPPIEAAGSSLLYSEEFYSLVKKRLKNGGILQQWFPAGEKDVLHAVTRALTNSFPHVAAYPSLENWGIHFFASRNPLPEIDVQTIYDRIPADARRDFLEWHQQKDLKKILHTTFDTGSIINKILQKGNACSITDDKPYNEYYLIRKWLGRF